MKIYEVNESLYDINDETPLGYMRGIAFYKSKEVANKAVKNIFDTKMKSLSYDPSNIKGVKNVILDIEEDSTFKTTIKNDLYDYIFKYTVMEIEIDLIKPDKIINYIY